MDDLRAVTAKLIAAVVAKEGIYASNLNDAVAKAVNLAKEVLKQTEAEPKLNLDGLKTLNATVADLTDQVVALKAELAACQADKAQTGRRGALIGAACVHGVLIGAACPQCSAECQRVVETLKPDWNGPQRPAPSEFPAPGGGGVLTSSDGALRGGGSGRTITGDTLHAAIRKVLDELELYPPQCRTVAVGDPPMTWQVFGFHLAQALELI